MKGKVIVGVLVIAGLALAVAAVLANPQWLERRRDVVELVTTLALLILTGAALWQTRATAADQVRTAQAASVAQAQAAKEQVEAARTSTTEQVRAIRETAEAQIGAQREAADQRAVGDREQLDIARRQAQDAVDRAERAERAPYRTELLVELPYRLRGEGVPVLQAATPNEIAASPIADRLRRKHDDDSMQKIELAVENLGPGIMYRFQQRWIPMGLRDVIGRPRFDYVEPQPLPYESVLKAGQRLEFPVWVSLMALMAIGQTQEEQNQDPEGSWREVGILEHRWQDGLGERHGRAHMIRYRSGGDQRQELRLERHPTTV